MKTIYETAGGKYEMRGDYTLLRLKVGDEEEYHIGVFGQRYRRYLREQHRILYYNYLTAGTLNRHIAEVDERANEMFDRLVKDLAEKENITEKLKADAPMEWVLKVNNIRFRAMEILNHDVIYVREGAAMKKFLPMIILLSTLAGCGNQSVAEEKMPVPVSQTTSTEIAATNWSETKETASISPDETRKIEKTEVKVASTESKEWCAATAKTDLTVTIQPTLLTEDQLQQESKTEDEYPETESAKGKTVTSTVLETARPELSNTPDCVPKSIYDYEFDVSAIRRKLVSIELEMRKTILSLRAVHLGQIR